MPFNSNPRSVTLAFVSYFHYAPTCMHLNFSFLIIRFLFFPVGKFNDHLIWNQFKKTLWPLFMDEVQLSQLYRASTMIQFTFYHSVPRSYWNSFNWPWKDERLSWSWRQRFFKLCALNILSYWIYFNHFHMKVLQQVQKISL